MLFSEDNFEQKIKSAYRMKQIFLPREEYALVMHELNSNMSDEDRESMIVTKPIGDYVYAVINRGFGDYVIVGKYPISDEDIEIMEETK